MRHPARIHVKRSGQPNCLKASLMNLVKMLGALLIAAGALGLIFGGLSFTKQTHKVLLREGLGGC
jgi:hypothetical protein